MLNVREMSHLQDTPTRDLRAECKALLIELEGTFNPKRRLWIEARLAFIDDLIRERATPTP